MKFYSWKKKYHRYYTNKNYQERQMFGKVSKNILSQSSCVFYSTAKWKMTDWYVGLAKNEH